MIDWSNILSQICYWGGILLGGVSIPAVIGFLSTTGNRVKLQNFIAKANNDSKEVAEKTAAATVDRVVGKLKTVTFKHDIEPIVKENLKEMNAETKKEYEEIRKQNAHIVNLFEAFSTLFSNSFYLTDEVKENIETALETAKADYYEQELAETKIDEELVEEEPKTENSPQNESHNTTPIER